MSFRGCGHEFPDRDERPSKFLKCTQLERVFGALKLCVAHGILEYWNDGNWEIVYIFLPHYSIIPKFHHGNWREKPSQVNVRGEQRR